MTRHDLRKRVSKQLRLALPVLLATMLGVVLPALAQPGQGHGKGQRDESGYDQSRGNRDDSDGPRGNSKNRGQKSDRGYSNQKRQAPDDHYDSGRNRDDSSGRGNANQKYRTSGDNDDYGRDRGENSGRGHANQQYRNADNYNNGRQVQQNRSLSAQGAAQRARSQYGGKVLKVQPSNNGYQVRLLKDDGRVVTVPIAN